MSSDRKLVEVGGKFKLERRLGKGAFGEVFLGVDSSTGINIKEVSLYRRKGGDQN